MAFFTWSQSLAAGATANPLDTAGAEWKYKYVPYDAVVEVIHRATAVGVVAQITSGSDEIQQSSPVSAGGTAGVITGRLNVEPVTFRAKQGDLIIVSYRNTTAGAINVEGSIEFTRVGG